MASGRIGPGSRDRWLCKVAAGGAAGAQAVTDLLALYPAGPEVAARLAGQAGMQAPAADPDDDLYATVYRAAPAELPPAHEVVHPGGQTTTHEHEHSDYSGGMHSHVRTRILAGARITNRARPGTCTTARRPAASRRCLTAKSTRGSSAMTGALIDPQVPGNLRDRLTSLLN